jgi:predicted polyphosphate/ATP-dependent NAD kinase
VALGDGGGGAQEGGRTIGVLINPIAGYGGPRAMHGTADLDERQHREALEGGRATERMRRTLERVAGRLPDGTRFVTAPGVLGGDLLAALGVDHSLVGAAPAGPTTAADTVEATRRVVGDDLGVDCLVFAGGDGTAVDVAAGVGSTLVVGVPAGVKMHSGVFARTPEAAGDLLVAVVEGRVRSETCDLLDVVGPHGPQVTGSVRVPAARSLLQGAKSVSADLDPTVLAALGRQLAAAAGPGAHWLLGPGATVADVAGGMGLASTVRGVDVVGADGTTVLDATEQQVFDAAGRPGTHLLLGVVGGQGFLFGRGNHELSARVLERLGPDRVHVVAAASKLASLVPPVLHVDLGDTHPVDGLDGYRAVHVGPGRTTMMRIVSSVAADLPDHPDPSALASPAHPPGRTATS